MNTSAKALRIGNKIQGENCNITVKRIHNVIVETSEEITQTYTAKTNVTGQFLDGMSWDLWDRFTPSQQKKLKSVSSEFLNSSTGHEEYQLTFEFTPSHKWLTICIDMVSPTIKDILCNKSFMIFSINNRGKFSDQYQLTFFI